MSQSIQWLLEQWGIWQRTGKSCLPHYVSPSAMLMSEHIQQSNITLNPQITDDHCLTIDREVARLAKRDATKAQVIFAYYVRRMADEWIGHHVGVSRSSARDLRLQAESWLDCAVLDSTA